MQNLLQGNDQAEMVRSLSTALIVFGTLAAALAVAATRREGAGMLTRLTDYFFGDVRERKIAEAEPAVAAEKPSGEPTAKATRREIDNFDLSIFENF